MEDHLFSKVMEDEIKKIFEVIIIFNEGQICYIWTKLIRTVNEHAESEGYAVIIARIKKSKIGVKRKT